MKKAGAASKTNEPNFQMQNQNHVPS